MTQQNIDYQNWNEDGYPSYDPEYWEEIEEENDEYVVGYDSIPSNIDLFEYENEGGFQKSSKRTRSLKSYYDKKAREKKAQEQRIRAEAKAKEKQRQQYYHYSEKIYLDEEESDEVEE